ncbi:hypothetical protein [Pseudobacillus badius]|uniref:hypothetical protein n=1 Tax=Bacillus badius TaxID=1455 RepID=UPI000597BDCD|nr:hypothetical protein [Bacillus badius]UAT32394.1 hypothetical protein K7T73_09370 [Bacillus badius]GLY12601.1 hypothetical protein Bbad01_38170 [Bacillus badius]
MTKKSRQYFQYLCLLIEGKHFFVIAEGRKFYLTDTRGLLPLSFEDLFKIRKKAEKGEHKVVGFGQYARSFIEDFLKNKTVKRVIG